MDESVRRARELAIERHGDQKYGDFPYIYHLDMVYQIIVATGLDKDYQIAAYLHDLIEDTSTTKEELASLFNSRVANLVDSVSGIGATRKEKKLSMLKKLEDFPEGINLKMADRFANMRESLTNPKLFEMYTKELDEYLPLFSQGNKHLLSQIQSLVLPRRMKP